VAIIAFGLIVLSLLDFLFVCDFVSVELQPLRVLPNGGVEIIELIIATQIRRKIHTMQEEAFGMLI